MYFSTKQLEDFIETMKDKFLIDYDYVFCQKPTVSLAVVFEPLTLEIFVEKTDECSF